MAVFVYVVLRHCVGLGVHQDVACSYCVSAVQISLGIMAALGLRLLLAGATRATADRQSGGDGRGRQREYERYEQQRQQQQQQQQRGGYGGGYGGPAWPGAGGQTGREQGRRQPPPMFFGAWEQDARPVMRH